MCIVITFYAIPWVKKITRMAAWPYHKQTYYMVHFTKREYLRRSVKRIPTQINRNKIRKYRPYMHVFFHSLTFTTISCTHYYLRTCHLHALFIQINSGILLCQSSSWRRKNDVGLWCVTGILFNSADAISRCVFLPPSAIKFTFFLRWILTSNHSKIYSSLFNNIR